MAKKQDQYIMGYIKDKDVYKAVMFACSLLKKGKSYHDAVRIAASYYDADIEQVRHYMSQRSGRSQTGNRKGRKYRYYVVCTYVACDANPEPLLDERRIKKAMSEKTAKRDWLDEDRRNDYGGSYAPYHIEHIEAVFDTLEEAQEYAKTHKPVESLWKRQARQCGDNSNHIMSSVTNEHKAVSKVARDVINQAYDVFARGNE